MCPPVTGMHERRVNRLYGHANYLRGKAKVGVQPGPLTLVGGSNIKLSDLTTTGGIGAAVARPSGPAPSGVPETGLKPDTGPPSHGHLRDEAWDARERRQGQT
jgi:hypothetical protein